METSRANKLLSPHALAFSLQENQERREKFHHGLDAFCVMRTVLAAFKHVILFNPPPQLVCHPCTGPMPVSVSFQH